MSIVEWLQCYCDLLRLSHLYPIRRCTLLYPSDLWNDEYSPASCRSMTVPDCETHKKNNNKNQTSGIN